jgi:hypothetical protein
MPSALDGPCASRAQLRPLLLDLALLVAALGCVDIAGITWTAALEARFTRAGNAVVVLNANEFDWRGVRVVIWAPGGTWNAEIDALRAGESLNPSCIPKRSLPSSSMTRADCAERHTDEGSPTFP